jgi:hypothetical protein
MRFFESILDAILKRSAEELIGALFIVAALGIVMAGCYAVYRKKSSPSPSFVGGMALPGFALCMVFTAGYVEYEASDWGRKPSVIQPASGRVWPGSPRWGFVSLGAQGSDRAAEKTGSPSRDRRRPFSQAALPHPWSVSGTGWSSGFHIVVAADENRDGRLTPDEAARLVRKADTDGDGSVNFRDIDRLIASRPGAPAWPPKFAAAGPRDLGRDIKPRGADRGARSSKGAQPADERDGKSEPRPSIPEERLR